MHEMSLAMSVMEIAQREMKRAGRTRLTGIEIEIGEQTGVERTSFVTALNAVTRSGQPAGAPPVRITLTDIPARAECLQCGAGFRPATFAPRACPACGSGQVLLTSGRDLRLAALTCE